jgi:ABC-type phosphate/phosphonate transport system ATPase subunit
MNQINTILTLLKDVNYDNNYFERLLAIENPRIQLSLLTYSTHEERGFALKV